MSQILSISVYDPVVSLQVDSFPFYTRMIFFSHSKTSASTLQKAKALVFAIIQANWVVPGVNRLRFGGA